MRVILLSLFLWCATAVLPSVYLESEYATSLGSWSTYTSSADFNSCGMSIYTSSNYGTAATYSLSIASPGTYATYVRIKTTNNNNLPSFFIKMDSSAQVIWDDYLMGNAWRPGPNFTLSAGTHTFTFQLRTGASYVYVDKFLFTDTSTPQSGYSDTGKRAQNIPAGKCQQFYFEAEFGTLNTVKFTPSAEASLESAVYAASTTQTSCSTSSRYIKLNATWTENVYRPVWIRMLAPTSSYSRVVVSSVSCGTYYTLSAPIIFQDYMWHTFSSGLYLYSDIYLALTTGYTYIDKIYIGDGFPYDTGAISNFPWSNTACTFANGFCDPVTTCSAPGTCTSCPFGYTGCANIATCSKPDGCVRTVPYGCFFNRTYAQWGVSGSTTFPTGAFTVEVWASGALGLQTTPDSYILHYASDTGTKDFQLMYNPLSSVGLFVSMSGVTIKPATPIILSLDIWTHIAVTWDGSSTVKFYINTILTATVATAATAVNSPGKISLGKSARISDYTSDLTIPTFSVDELRIWSAALDSTALADSAGAPLTTNQVNLMHSFDFGPSTGTFLTCPSSSTEQFGTATFDWVPTELAALKALFWATGGPWWYGKTTWLAGSPCSGSSPLWFGLDCTTNRVTTINLAFNNLNGLLPPGFFGAFPKLTIMMLDHNSITGPVPADIGMLTSATAILLHSNQLTTFPTTIGKLSKVVKLYLQDNAISGPLPEVFSNMISLDSLFLARNQINGSIPTTLVQSSVKYLDISSNSLSGTIPQVIMDSRIRSMNFSGNSLGGELPNRNTKNNTQMTTWDFSGSNFKCKIPPFTRVNNLTFSLVLTGSTFFCPLNDVSQMVTGQTCETVTIFSLTPSNFNLSRPLSTIAITVNASGLHSCVGIRVLVPGLGLLEPATLGDSLLTFNMPRHDPGIVPIKLQWLGTYSNNTVLSANSVDFKFYYPCPDTCVSPYGVCAGLSGVCRCNGTRGGPDCHQLSCPANCNGRGVCDYATGKCNCTPPYFGDTCSAAKIECPTKTSSSCSGHGQCDVFTGICSCYLGYWGSDCSNKTCPPYNKPFCGHGICNGTSGACICDSGWLGDSCTIPVKTCPDDCTNKTQGQCDQTTGNCTCFTYLGIKYGGANCASVICSPPCINGGSCNTSNSLCVCPTNYYGADCSVPHFSCPNNCTDLTHGDCNTITGNCSCRAGLMGDDCSIHVCPGSPQCSYPNGTCDTTTGNCVCANNTASTKEYFTGYMCQYHNYVCDGNPVCSGNGYCNPVTGVCMCNYPFDVDPICSTARCPNNCWSHGDCDVSAGVCHCWAEYNTTLDCQFLYVPCTSSCNNGYCDTRTGECVCTSPWVDSGTDKCYVKLCPGDCTPPNGVCANGTCICNSGWTGVSCSIANRTCATDCSSPNGRCDTTSGNCFCYGSYYGDACQYKSCLANCSHHGVCNVTTGVCSCDVGWEPPDCFVNLCSTLDFCTSGIRGKCNTTVGSCVCIDPYYGDSCQYKLCPLNCSGNGVCDPDQGVCTCDQDWIGAGCDTFSAMCQPSRTYECYGNGVCDHTTGICDCMGGYFGDDCSKIWCPNNCSGHGDCNYTSGVCSCYENYTDPSDSTCSSPYFPCSDSDCSGNGFCNTAQGKCYCYSGFWGDKCQNMYCPPKCDQHGACNATNGVCECQQWWSGPACLEPTHTCPNNCTGTHGACDKTTGECICYSPWVAPDCVQASCYMNCSWPNGECTRTTGVCSCSAHYTGKGCQIANYSCTPSCVHGSCDTTTGNCVCIGGYFGSICTYKQCPGVTPCTGHGYCNNLTGVCYPCDGNWTGSACEIPNIPCPNNCTSKTRGICNSQTGQCMCQYPYTSNDCSTMRCPNDCRGHGICNTITGICECNATYLQPDCYFRSCPNNCTSHGTCNPFTGVCTCSPVDDWGGDDCATRLCPESCSGSGDCIDGVCNCKVGTTGDGCEKQNWWIIVVCAGGGAAVIGGASVASFAAVRQLRIKNAKARRAATSTKYVDMEPKKT